MQHEWICSVVDLEIFVRGPELFIFDSNRWLVYHDESSFVFSALQETVCEKRYINPTAFARPPTCFKAFLAWMFSLPKFPDPSTWPWWLSIWLWWLEDGFFHFPSWRDNGKQREWREDEGGVPLITPFLFQVISSCNDECIDFSSLVRDFPILKKTSLVSKLMQLLARTTRAASLAFLSQCFAGKSKPSITQELIFCLKHIIFNPLHRLKSGGCPSISLPLILGSRGGFRYTKFTSV